MKKQMVVVERLEISLDTTTGLKKETRSVQLGFVLTLKNRTWYSELTTLLSDGKKLRLRGRDGFFLNRFVFSEHEETTLLASSHPMTGLIHYP